MVRRLPDTGKRSARMWAPYFIGVFDTVAALCAGGMRRIVIPGTLIALIAIVAFIPSLPAGVLGAVLVGWPFWTTLGLVDLVLVLGGAAWLWVEQRRDVRKTIHDFPKPGEHRSHLARWEGQYLNRR